MIYTCSRSHKIKHNQFVSRIQFLHYNIIIQRYFEMFIWDLHANVRTVLTNAFVLCGNYYYYYDSSMNSSTNWGLRILVIETSLTFCWVLLVPGNAL